MSDPVRAAYVVALGDDALVAAQRMGEWIAAAPQIEEDVALGNIALDLLGQARSLLSYAGSLEDPARTEDDLAYFRDEREFRNVQLVERGWGRERRDFGVAMARLLILSTYQHALYSALVTSTDETLAAVAAKAVKEVDYHRDHATMWVLRLGDGTEESHARVQAALDEEWRYVDELFDGSFVRAGAGRRRRRRRPRDAARDLRRPGRHGAARGDPDAAGGHPRGDRRPPRRAHPGDGLPARRDAAPDPLAPGGDVVISTGSITRDDRVVEPVETTTRQAAWDVAAAVLDPEVPVVTIEDLGILRSVEVDEAGAVRVAITPTYSGCPAMDTIRADLLAAFAEAGYADVRVDFVLAPAWTTDWMTEEGRRKLEEFGIAPPTARPARRPGLADAVGALPAVRLARHPRAEPVRLHGVQVAVGLQRLPGAVRPLQGPLTPPTRTDEN